MMALVEQGTSWTNVCDLCFFQAEDGIRYLVRSRGLGDVYKRQRQKSGTLPTERGDALGT